MVMLQQLSCLCSLSWVILLLQSWSVDCQECEPECKSGHGICINGGCFCSSPWGGEDCSSLVAGSGSTSAQPTGAAPLTSAQLDEDPQTKEALATELPDVVHQNLLPTSPAGLQGILGESIFPATPAEVAISSQSLALPPELPRTMHQHFPQTPPASSRGILLRKSIFSSRPTEVASIWQSQANACVCNHGTPVPEASCRSNGAEQCAECFGGYRLIRNMVNDIICEAIEVEPKALHLATAPRPAAPSLRLFERLPSTASISAPSPTNTRRTNFMKLQQHSRTRYRVVSSSTDKDTTVISPSRVEKLELAGTRRTKDFIDTETCYYVPIGIQIVLFALIALFVFLDFIAHHHEGTHEKMQSSWFCGCCACCARCVTSMNWHTSLFVLIFIVAINGMWIYLCYSGTAQKYMEQFAFIVYLGFIFLGALTILVLELYYRYWKPRLKRMHDLEEQVEKLVHILSVKYKEDLKAGGMLAADRLDDVTDFLGVTEASSDDDVTCVEAVRCKPPSARAKGLKKGTDMSSLKRESKMSKT